MVKQYVFIIKLILLSLINNQVNTSFSSTAAKARRVQSIRAMSPIHELKPVVRPQSTSMTSSSSSSTSSIPEIKSIASTSAVKETELQPLTGKTKHVGFTRVDLTETGVSTYPAGNLNSPQTVVQTRMRLQNTLRRYGLRVVAASAIGTGGFLAVKNLYSNNTAENNTISSLTSITSINSTSSIKPSGEITDSDEIDNNI